LAVGAVIGASLFALFELLELHTPRDRVDSGLARLRTYCTTVYVALDMDARDLESGDPKRQQEAADRFGGQTTYHSEQEIGLCASSLPDLRTRDVCWLAKDYSCLAKLARSTASSTRPEQR
jgi:hypothetical protein